MEIASLFALEVVQSLLFALEVEQGHQETHQHCLRSQ
jgi:hypothetical protein